MALFEKIKPVSEKSQADAEPTLDHWPKDTEYTDSDMYAKVGAMYDEAKRLGASEVCGALVRWEDDHASQGRDHAVRHAAEAKAEVLEGVALWRAAREVFADLEVSREIDGSAFD